MRGRGEAELVADIAPRGEASGAAGDVLAAVDRGRREALDSDHDHARPELMLDAAERRCLFILDHEDLDLVLLHVDVRVDLEAEQLRLFDRRGLVLLQLRQRPARGADLDLTLQRIERPESARTCGEIGEAGDHSKLRLVLQPQPCERWLTRDLRLDVAGDRFDPQSPHCFVEADVVSLRVPGRVLDERFAGGLLSRRRAAGEECEEEEYLLEEPRSGDSHECGVSKTKADRARCCGEGGVTQSLDRYRPFKASSRVM